MTRAPEPTANFFSDGDQRTKVAARLMRRRTRVGFHPEGDGSQTYAFLSTMFTRSAYSVGCLKCSHTLGTRHNSTSSGGDIDTCDGLIMSFQLVLQCEPVPRSAVKLNVVIPCNG